MNELYQVVTPANAVGRLLLNMGEQNVVAHGSGVRGEVDVLQNGQHVVGAASCVRGRHIDNSLLASGLHHGVKPVEQLGGFVDPHLDDVLVALAGSVTGELVEQLHAVNFAALSDGGLGVHDAPVLAGLGDLVVLVGKDELHAKVGSRASGAHARGASANNKEVGFLGLLDIRLGNLRLNAQPCGSVGLCSSGALRSVALSGVARRSTTSKTRACGSNASQRSARKEVAARNALVRDFLFHYFALLV